jgi:hypothetical protein
MSKPWSLGVSRDMSLSLSCPSMDSVTDRVSSAHAMAFSRGVGAIASVGGNGARGAEGVADERATTRRRERRGREARAEVGGAEGHVRAPDVPCRAGDADCGARAVSNRQR